MHKANIEKEKDIVEEMISLYCRKNHKIKDEICEECEALKIYALSRTENCPIMKNTQAKGFCSRCKVRCYEPIAREKIRKVMRFSGHRLLFKHPILVIKHLILSIIR